MSGGTLLVLEFLVGEFADVEDSFWIAGEVPLRLVENICFSNV